jgi:hypothetical protein
MMCTSCCSVLRIADMCLGLARIVFLHPIWPNIWWLPCLPEISYIHCIYVWFWPALHELNHVGSSCAATSAGYNCTAWQTLICLTLCSTLLCMMLCRLWRNLCGLCGSTRRAASLLTWCVYVVFESVCVFAHACMCMHVCVHVCAFVSVSTMCSLCRCLCNWNHNEMSVYVIVCYVRVCYVWECVCLRMRVCACMHVCIFANLWVCPQCALCVSVFATEFTTKGVYV